MDFNGNFVNNGIRYYHGPLPKIRWSEDVTRVGDAYTQGKYLTYMR